MKLVGERIETRRGKAALLIYLLLLQFAGCQQQTPTQEPIRASRSRNESAILGEPPAGWAPVNPDLAAASRTPGSTPFSTTVAQDGQSHISIPIVVPPGRNGMAPRLSLEYSSSGGDGHVGLGWTVGGASQSVSRCQATPGRDGTWLPAATGGFCLNGAKLVPFALNEYRTEFESNARVTFDPSRNAWSVQSKEGMTQIFGWHWPETAPESGTALWKLTSEEDAFGNLVGYEYGTEGEPSTISWGGVRNAPPVTGLGPWRRVEFAYESRLEPLRSLRMAQELRVTRRLTDIKLFSPNQVAGLSTAARPLGPVALVRAYKLAYRTFSGDEVPRDILASVSECDPGGICKRPLEFETTTTRWAWSAERRVSDQHVRGLTLGDFNGDGLTDLAVIPWQGAGWQVMQQQAGLPMSFGPPQAAGLGQPSFVRKTVQNPDGGTMSRDALGTSAPSPIDLDLDGIPEVLSGAWPVNGPMDPAFGDALVRLYIRNASGTYAPISLPGPRADLTSRAMIADLDGDGLPDILDFDHWNHILPDGGSWETHEEDAPSGRLYVRWNNSLPGSIAFSTPVLFGSRDCEPCGRGVPPSVCDNDTTPPETECDSEDILSATSAPSATELHVPRKSAESIRADFIGTASPRRGGNEFATYVVDSDEDGVPEVNYRQSLSDLTYRYTFNGSTPFEPHVRSSNLVRRARHVGGRVFVTELLRDRASADAIRVPARLDDDSAPDQWQLSPVTTALIAGPNGLIAAISVRPAIRDVRIVDLDLDGRDDLLDVETLGVTGVRLFASPNSLPTLRVRTIAGTTPGWMRTIESIGEPAWPLVFQVGDVTGDGGPDLVYAKSDGIYLREHLGRGGFVTAVRQGTVRGATITYKPLREGDNYRRGTNCVLPQRCVASGPLVVGSLSTLVQENGAVRTARFSFEDGRTDIGRGWIGFSKVIREEPVALMREETTYNLAPALLGSGSTLRGYSQTPARIMSCVDLREGAGGRAIMQESTLVSPIIWKPIGSVGRYNQHKPRSVQTTVLSEIELANGAPSPCTIPLVKTTAFRDVRTRTSSMSFEEGTPVSVFERSWLGGPVNGTPVNPPGGLLTSSTTVTLWPSDTSGDRWLVGLPKTTITEETDAQGAIEQREVLTEYAPRTTLVSKTTLMPHAPIETTTTSGMTREVEVFRDWIGNVIAVENRASGSNRRTEYTYDGSEQIFAVRETKKPAATSPDLIRYAFMVPSTGAIAAIDDWNGLRTEHRYDTLGRLKGSTGPEGYPLLVRWSEDLTGHLKVDSTEDLSSGAQGTDKARLTSELFDLLGRPVRTERTGWNGKTVVQTTAYDNNGRVERQSLPFFTGASPEFTIFVYDRLGRPVLSRNTATGDISTAEYAETTTKLFDPLGVKVEVTRDSRGRPMQTIEAHGTSSYSWGPFNTLVSTSDQRGTTTATYDALGRRTTAHDPNSGQSSWFYNGYGEFKRVELERGGVLTFERDLFGRETSTTLAPGLIPGGLVSNVSRSEWDTAPHGKGALARQTSMDGVVTTFGYDTVGRVEAETTVIPNVGTYSFSSTFDTRGDLKSLTYPDTTQILYSHGDYGELQGVYQAGAAWPMLMRIDDVNAASQVLSQRYGNGVETSSQFDSGFRLEFRQTQSFATLSGALPAVLQKFKYEYAGGRISARHELSSLLSERFQYDNSGRLAQWRVDQSTNLTCRQTIVDYSYDAEGNLAGRDSSAYPDVINSYQGAAGGTDAIKTSQEGNSPASTFSWDTAGNQTGFFSHRPATGLPDRELSWTYFNLPRTITDRLNTGVQWTMSYDTGGQRVLRQGSNAVREVTLGAGLFSSKIELSGVTSTSTVRAGGRDIAQLTRTGAATSVAFVHADEKGSPDAISSGLPGRATLLERAKFDPFGERRDASDVAAPSIVQGTRNLSFTGHQDDGFAALTNMQGRIYDQHAGRFLSADPIATTPFLSRARNGYSYAANDPVNRVDRSGYFPEIFLSFGSDWSAWVATGLAIGASIAGQQAANGQAGYNSSSAPGSTGDELTRWRPPPEVSPPDNSLYMGAPTYPGFQAAAERIAIDSNESWATRAAAAVLGVAVAPIAVVDQFVLNPIINAPWTIHNAGIRIGERAARIATFMEGGRARQGEGQWDVVIEGTSFVQDFSEGFTAAATVATLAQSVGRQALREAASIELRPIRPTSLNPCAEGLCKGESCFPAGTLVAVTGGAVPIERVEVGDMVSSAGTCTAPEGWDTELTLEVVSPTWGGIAHVVLLRPAPWLDAVGLGFGADVPLSLPDLGVDGTARLVSVRSRDVHAIGCVITGTVAHEAEWLVSLYLSTGERLRATPVHPLFSATRGSWVQAGLLLPGEVLATVTGDVTIETTELEAFGARVFNLEVTDSHEYLVGVSSIRAHNTCVRPPLQRIHSPTTYLSDSEAKASLDYWRGRPTDEIIESLRPGGNEALRTWPDGRMMNGNTRTLILEERGVNINRLPREVRIENPDTFEIRWETLDEL